MASECGAAITVLQGRKLKETSNKANVQLLLSALKACSRTRNLESGKQVHAEAVECGQDCNNYVANALIKMYVKCDSMVEAREVFDRMKYPTVVSWTALILGYAKNGQGHTALEFFNKLKTEGPSPNSATCVAAVKACSSVLLKGSPWTEYVNKCKEIHRFAALNGCISDIHVLNSFVDMYSKCGSMVDARGVFDCIKNPDVVSWTALILGYVSNGQSHIALDLFTNMIIEGPSPNSVTFVAALKACTFLAVKGAMECMDRGKLIHNFAVENGCNSAEYVQNSLLDLYAKCGSMVVAREVFDNMKCPTVVSWNVLILGYAGNAQGHAALEMFIRMRTEGPAPDSSTIVAVLKACTSLALNKNDDCKDRGKEMHNIIIENGFDANVYVQSTLVDMFAKCRSMVDAREVFDVTKQLTVVTWNVLIWGYVDNGEGQNGLDMYIRMRTEGPAPVSVTYGAALKACGLVGALEFGRVLHSEIDPTNGFDVVLVTCLVDFYAKCGSFVEAQSVFDMHAQKRDMITWSALLAGFSSCGDSEAVFGLFERMQDAGFRPDGITFQCILTCCSHAGLIKKGKECFDAMSTKFGINPSIEHYTCMIDLFGRTNKLDDALALLMCMPYNPDDVIWTTILGACRKWKNVDIGRLAFKSLIDINDRDANAYLLMGQIYGSRGMLQEQEIVIEHINFLKAYKQPGETSWTNEAGNVHTFSGENRHHLQIRKKWESMVLVMKQHGYTPSITHEIICGHSERLALVCALTNTRPGKTIRIVKNLKFCYECHIATGIISKLACRTIICRDANRIHVFKDGKCSCGDLW